MTYFAKTTESAEPGVKSGGSLGSHSGELGWLNKKLALPRALPRPVSNPRGGLKSGGPATPYTYRFVKVVGSGSFGVVVQAKIEETGEDVAIKQVRYDSRLHNRELYIMRDVIQAGGEGGAGGSTPLSAAPNPQGRSPSQSLELLPNASSPLSVTTPMSGSFFLLRRHPNIVQLRTYYHSTDPETNEPYVNLVMNYLPTDFFAMKEKYFKCLRESAGAKKGGGAPRKKDLAISNPTPTGTVEPGEGDSNSTGGNSNSGNGNNHSNSTLFPLMWTKLILFQLGRALAFLHGKHVCHRDIKPANILIDPETGRLQLCDFGSAKRMSPKNMEKNVSYICSRYYRAPELLFGVMHYGCEVDMWSVGCIAAELLREGGHPIFKGITTVDQMAEIFKVLGAPSISEMYAMNAQSAAAMLQTHRQYGGKGFPPPTMPGGGGSSTAAATSIPLPPASSRGIPSEDERNPREDRGDLFSTAPCLGSDYFEHYDVLKVKALAWTHVLHREAPPEAVKLVSELLHYVPSKRLTAVEFVEHALFDNLFSHDLPHYPNDKGESLREGGGGTSPPWRLPRMENGKTLPIEMFMLTETETQLYSEEFQRKMNREVQRIHAAMQATGTASFAGSR
ncbi:unnamed protein product [Phytomonas sp. Hart1]|nr:unnamed protein product [Phytomonas sp. Hart1]|eukprot:CCW72114.1 unnamed protein product [Phytomonas sp. isolate Hart1]